MLTDIEASSDTKNELRLPPMQLKHLREYSFDLLAAFCHGSPRNQVSVADDY